MAAAGVHCPVDGRRVDPWRLTTGQADGINVRGKLNVTGRWVPLVVISGLLGVAALAASIAAPGVHRRAAPPPLLPSVSTRPNDPFGGSAPPVGPSGAIAPLRDAWLLATIVFAIALVLAVFLLWHLIVIRRRPFRQYERDRDGTPEPLTVRDVVTALNDAIARLAGEGDARSAVIACWVRLEQATQAAGTPRALSDAPADLVTRLLGAYQVSKPALTSLADLYRTARYSAKPIDNPMRERALSALTTVRSEIAASLAAPIDDRDPVRGGSVWRRP